MAKTRTKKIISIELTPFSFGKVILLFLVLSEIFKRTELVNQSIISDKTEAISMLNLSDPCTYLSAIYTGETVRYVGPTVYHSTYFDESEHAQKIQKYRDTIALQPEIFIADTEYRSIIHPISYNPGPYNVPPPVFKYGSVFEHTLDPAPLYGFSGSKDMDAVLGYAKDKSDGFIFGMEPLPLNRDFSKIKIDSNKLFELFDIDNPYSSEKEVYHLYLDPKTQTILTEPMNDTLENYVNYLNWVIELSSIPSVKKGESVPNLLKPGETININQWIDEQKESVARNKASLFHFEKRCQLKKISDDSSRIVKNSLEV